MDKLITILGPTASGKTQLAVALAHRIGGEIISADSRQVYRRMDIGTGKDLTDYGGVPYHLIDICEPGTKYNLFQYEQDFRHAVPFGMHAHAAFQKIIVVGRMIPPPY